MKNDTFFMITLLIILIYHSVIIECEEEELETSLGTSIDGDQHDGTSESGLPGHDPSGNNDSGKLKLFSQSPIARFLTVHLCYTFSILSCVIYSPIHSMAGSLEATGIIVVC